MKALISSAFLVAFLMPMLVPGDSFAQTNDTLVVSAFPIGNLNIVINADTNATGQQQHVYLLQQTGSLDTTYFLTAPIVVKSNLTIIGERNPTTGNLPVIEPNINPDNSVTNYYVREATGVVTLKGLYFLATRLDSATSTAYAFNESGDSTTLIADHDVFDNFNNANILDFHGSHCKIFVSNSEFRNIQAPFWQGGSIFWAESGYPMDTVSFVNNTFFCVNRAIYGSPGWIGYLDFDHNTVFCGVGGLLLAQQLTNATITNNIFYSVIGHGADSSYIKNGSANGAHQGFGIIMVDTLKGFTHLPYPGYTEMESQRSVVVSDNAYCWSPDLYAYWAAVADTGAAHHPGLITPPQWMNPQTAYEFGSKTQWPGFFESDNDSTNPGFAQSLTTPAVDSLINFVNLIWTGGHIPSWRWYQNFADPIITDPVNVFNWAPKNWWTTQGYPVPENLRYSNAALQFAGTDGKALGDLNWFPEQITSAPPAVPVLALPAHNTTGVPRRATLAWNPSMGATSYHLQIATDTTFTSVEIDTTLVDTTVHLSKILAATTQYYWHVSAANTVFSSAYSAVDSFKTGTGVDAINEAGGLPTRFALLQNYPNPFNPTTEIRYDLPKVQMVNLKVYNILGQKVATLVNARQNPGYYSVTFNGDRFASGVYFYVLKTDNFSSVQKMLLLK